MKKTLFQKSLVAAALLAITASASVQAGAVPSTAEVRKSTSLTDTGFNYMREKDYARAKPYFERALEIEPNLAMAHLDLGAVYMNTGEPEAAREQFRLAIENDTAAHDYPAVRETTDDSNGTVTEIANRNLQKMH